MRTFVLCLAFAVTTACSQKSDMDYVGAKKAPLVAQLRDLFNGDFYDACLSTPPAVNLQTMEPSCGPPPNGFADCEELWAGRPPLDQSDGWVEWEAKYQANLDRCPGWWEQVTCWPSEKDQAIDRVLEQRDKLRGRIWNNLSTEEQVVLPAELHGLIVEDWACNWWANSDSYGIRFGTPTTPSG